MTELTDQTVDVSFLDANGEMMFAGYDEFRQIVFYRWDEAEKKDVLALKCDVATFEAICNRLSLRPPIFQDQMKSYLDEKFERVEKLIAELREETKDHA